MRALLLLASFATLATAAAYAHFTGRVIDENGRPIEGAFFHHTAMDSSEFFERLSNAEGRFDIWTGSTFVVLRKSGYRSIVLRPKSSLTHEFIMKKETRPFPVCGNLRPKVADASRSSFKVLSAKLNHGRDLNPSDQDVGSSTQYMERTFSIAGLDVIDARGVTRAGLQWRSLGRINESLSYRDADSATAKLLDEFLDRTCLELRP